jgi:GDP-L-fucose synthase
LKSIGRTAVVENYALAGKRVFVAGHRGMAGAAIARRLARENCEVLVAGRETLDLEDGAAVSSWFSREKPDAVFLAAARVGGIYANDSQPVDFLERNLFIAANVIKSAYAHGVGKLLFLGSSCIYPRLAPQPMSEDALLTGPLEPTNEWYAIAKIAGIKLCQAYRKQYGADFISAMPTNLYGPRDNYHPTHSHVPAALIRRFHEAKIRRDKSVTVWGTGAPKREFLHVDDLADACVHLMKVYSDAPQINVGTGHDITIREFAEAVARTIGFDGAIHFDTARPDGAPRKLLNVDRLTALGWRARISLADGLQSAYADFLEGAVREV